jgi:hypothetical protein
MRSKENAKLIYGGKSERLISKLDNGHNPEMENNERGELRSAGIS